MRWSVNRSPLSRSACVRRPAFAYASMTISRPEHRITRSSWWLTTPSHFAAASTSPSGAGIRPSTGQTSRAALIQPERATFPFMICKPLWTGKRRSRSPDLFATAGPQRRAQLPPLLIPSAIPGRSRSALSSPASTSESRAHQRLPSTAMRSARSKRCSSMRSTAPHALSTSRTSSSPPRELPNDWPSGCASSPRWKSSSSCQTRIIPGWKRRPCERAATVSCRSWRRREWPAVSPSCVRTSATAKLMSPSWCTRRS